MQSSALQNFAAKNQDFWIFLKKYGEREMNSKMFQKNQNYFWIQKIEFENYLLDGFIIDFEKREDGFDVG